jgi:hypothetical protein
MPRAQPPPPQPPRPLRGPYPTACRPAVLLAVLAALLTTACGHKASVAECEEIIERIARLELEKKNPNNPDAVNEEIEATKKSLRDTTMKDCVGKRITASAMKCVRTAKSSKEIVEDCFD